MGIVRARDDSCNNAAHRGRGIRAPTPWSNSTRAGHAAIPDSRRPDIRIGRERADVSRMEQALQHVRDEITKAVKAREQKWFRRELIVCAVVAVGATLTTLVTMLVLGNILREIAIEMFETLRVWWAG